MVGAVLLFGDMRQLSVTNSSSPVTFFSNFAMKNGEKIPAMLRMMSTQLTGEENRQPMSPPLTRSAPRRPFSLMGPRMSARTTAAVFRSNLRIMNII